MKKILLILSLFPILVFSQKSYKIPADSTILNNIGSGKNELVIRNATSNITGGVLTNLGNGVTAFVLGGGSARVVDTIYKNNTKDSIVFTISGIRYAVKDSFNLNTDSQTLSISNDTLTISGGNSVILPVYIQIDSSTINSYDVLNSQNAPPVSPNTGDTYLVGNSPTGAWVGQAKDIAEWNGSAWVFTDGVQGDFLYNATNALTYIFRSGNWVQTTGIPALNNGNSISSGLKIGTNNARSLTFETNNTNRGRFDSIGRFHIYNLPTASTGDTFVTKSDLSGKLTKVGQSTFLSGVNTSLFPNGLEIVTESRDFLTTDLGKLIIIFPGAHLTMPNEIIFPELFKTIGILQIDTTCWFEQEFGGAKIKSLTTENFPQNEIVLCISSLTDNDSASRLLFLSTAIINEQTAGKYLYDQSQNAIPLSGTVSGSPVTGDIVFFDGANTTNFTLSFSDGLQIYNDKNTNVFSIDGTNSTSTGIILQSDKDGVLDIGSSNVSSRGIVSANDYSANITDLDYTQKIYVDNAISSNRKVDTSYIFRNATLDSICMVTVINGISYRSCGKDSVGAGSSTLALDKITDAVDSSTLNAGNYKQEWQWNSLANNTGFKLSSTSGGLLNTQNRLFEVQMSGAMPASGNSSYAGYFKNTQTGGGAFGLYAEGPATAINAVGNINTSTGFFINNDFSLSNTAGGSNVKAASSSRLNLRGDNLINFQNIAGTINYASINNITDNVRQSLLFNGVYVGGQFYCSATTSAMVERSSDKLIFSANSGLTANTPFTPNNIMTVYGTNSNVGIGTTSPVASAKLEVSSTTSGFLPPRMTATQASAISTPSQGLLLFVTDTDGTFTSVGWWGYNGATWEKLNN